MTDNPLLATALSLPDNLKRELLTHALYNLKSLECGFSTDIDYDTDFLSLAGREYRIFFVTKKGSTTRYGILVKPDSTVENTYCRVVVTTKDGEDAPVLGWGRAMIRRDDRGKMLILPGW